MARHDGDFLTKDRCAAPEGSTWNLQANTPADDMKSASDYSGKKLDG